MLVVTCSKGEFWDVPCISWHEMLVSHLVVFREEVTYNEVKHLSWRCLLRRPLYKMSWNATCHEDVFWDDPRTKCREMLLVMKICFEMTPVQSVVKCYLSWRCVLRRPLYKMSWNASCHEAVFWDDPCTKCKCYLSWSCVLRRPLYKM